MSNYAPGLWPDVRDRLKRLLIGWPAYFSHGTPDSDALPRTCFVSHSYEDEYLVPSLRKVLPQHVALVVFSPIKVPPDQRVSDDLVAAILKCSGLIYINTINSTNSVWVNFECDFALRNGLSVYSFNPSTAEISREWPRLIDPPVITWLWGDADRARPLIAQVQEHMKKRSFHLETQMIGHIPDYAIEDMMNNLKVELSGGQSFVLYVCRGAGYDGWTSFFNFVLSSYRSQIILVILEPLEADTIVKWFPSAPRVDIFNPAKSGEIDWRRVDDLIVRVFYMAEKGLGAAGHASR
jgi:hypothetical protein